MQNPETLNLFLIIITVAVIILTVLLAILVTALVKIARDIQWMTTLFRREAQGLFQYIDEMRAAVDNSFISKGLLVEGILLMSKLFSGKSKTTTRTTRTVKKTKSRKKS